jgi:predicted RNA binding protein YcfA (HicA-like mRNA interferase family)
MGLTTSKDVNNLIKEAERQGWLIVMTRNSHLKWTSPTGAFFFSSSTPSDWRVVMKITKDLRMNGFIEIKRKQPRKKR